MNEAKTIYLTKKQDKYLYALLEDVLVESEGEEAIELQKILDKLEN